MAMILTFKLRFAMVLATWFGSGLIKLAPGTCGSLAALPFAWLLYDNWCAPGLAGHHTDVPDRIWASHSRSAIAR